MFPGTATLESLIDEVVHNLGGFTQLTDAMTTLNAAVAPGDTTLTVVDARSFSQGVAEIGTELLYITDVDVAANTLSLPAWGRGFRGTTAESHAAGERVTMSPAWPRATVAREINNVIRSLYPWLYAVKKATLTPESTEYAYPLPTDCVRVIDVKWRVPGTRRAWERIRHWDYDLAADVDDFPSGKAVELFSGEVPTASEVQVTYAAKPQPLAGLASAFTESGLDESVKDLVVVGTAARLAPYLDASRLPVQAAAADELDQPRQFGSAADLAREFRQTFNQRLLEEQKSLQDRYPLRMRRVR